MLEVEGSPNSSDQDGEDSDKPLVDDEWLAIHVCKKKKEKLMKNLRNNCNID